MAKKMKKAQVTPFIIIGIVLLISASFFIYYRNLMMYEPETIPDDIMPVKTYIQSCIDEISKDAVIKLGIQGGYINIPDHMRLNQAYIEMMPRSLIKIPYWYYNGFDYAPTIESMQKEISSYVKENLRPCLDLEIYEKDYGIKELGKISVKTTIAEFDVDIRIDYPLKVLDKSNNEQTEISKFYTILPVKLKHVYELSKKITEAQKQMHYFENITIDWVSMNADIPLNGLEFHCDPLKWNVRDVKRELQDMVYYFLPRLRIKNTGHTPFLKDKEIYENFKKYSLEDIYKGNYPKEKPPADAYDYSHYYLDVKSRKTDIKVGFNYNYNFDMQMSVTPSDNGIMRSTKQKGSKEFLNFLCLNFYHFTYDITYPVEVILNDVTAFNNNGYTFRFSLPVMVNHNKPANTAFQMKKPIMLGGDFIGECEDLDGPIYDIRVLSLDDYGIINQEINNVSISYDCIRFSCDLGSTTVDEGSYRLRTRLPTSCSHGFLVAKKKGYLEASTQVLDSTDIDIHLKKLKSFNFAIVQNKYNSITNEFGQDEIIQDPLYAVIDIQSIDDPSLSFYYKYPLNKIQDKQEQILLIEQHSKYKIDILLFDEADNTFIGGYQGTVQFDYNDIANNNNILFHVANYLPKAMNKDDERNVLNFLDENEYYKTKLTPEFK
jgi:hypothetical protein